MNSNFKNVLSGVLSFFMALPVYSKQKTAVHQTNAKTAVSQAIPATPDKLETTGGKATSNSETREQVITPEASAQIVRSPEDQMQSFVEKWNASANLNELIKNLSLSEKQKDVVKKMRTSLGLSNQKLPKVEFDADTMHLTFDKNKKDNIHLLQFMPFMVVMQNKLLVFDQTDEAAAMDYLFKQFSAKPGETVLFDFMLPQAHAIGFAPIMWAFLGIAFLVTVIPMAINYFEKKEHEEKRENQSVKNSAPEYRDFSEQVNAQGNRLKGLYCNNDRLFKLSFQNQKNETWDLTFDDNDDNNNIRFLTITSGQSVCRFVVEEEIWKRVPGMPTSCRAPYRLPYQYPDYMMVDPSRRCCSSKYKKCSQWVAQDTVYGKALGSSAPAIDKKGHQ